MKATFNGKTNAINSNHRREKGFDGGYIAIAVDNNGCHEVVDLRYYWTDTRCYCCVWINKPSQYTGGSAYASGYGYHKASAAAEIALHNAGWSLSERIHSVGDSAVEEAVRAIAGAVYPKASQIAVIHAHP